MCVIGVLWLGVLYLTKVNLTKSTCIVFISNTFMNCFSMILQSVPSSHLVIPMFTFNILAKINVWYVIWESIFFFKEKHFLQKAYLYLVQSCIMAFVTFTIRSWLDSLSFKLMFLFDTYTHTCHSSKDLHILNVVLISKNICWHLSLTWTCRHIFHQYTWA